MSTKYFLSVIVLFVSLFAISCAQSIKEVNSKEVSIMLQNDKKLVLLDVRTPLEFSSGHILGAINIDVNQPNALDSINKLDHNAKYIVYCRTKNRSGVAAKHMQQNGFITVYQMMDGITGWNQNGLSVVK